MPLSKPEETENHFFDTVLSKVKKEINQLVKDDNERRFYLSLVVGGTKTASEVVKNCEGVRQFWGDGSEESAYALIELFSFLMLFQCYRWLDEKDPELGEKQKASRLATTAKLLYLFKDESEESLANFLNLDAQFKHDVENRSPYAHLACFFLARACEACGHKCIDWSRVSFPVSELTELVSSGAILDSKPMSSIHDISALRKSHNAGIQAMNKYYEESN